MPSFEIPDGPTTVPLKSEGGFYKGSAVFSVTNKSVEGLTARLSVQIQGDGKPEWYQVQGESERPVAAGETQTVTVVAKVPGATPAGQHRIKLRAINVNDPDNDSTESSAAAVTIPAAAAPKPAGAKPFPWWILAVVGGGLVLVIGVIIAIVVMSGGSKVPSVVGKPYADAVKDLDKAGYIVIKRLDEETGEQPPETVLVQDPVADTKAKKGAGVALTVAMAKSVLLPDQPVAEGDPDSSVCNPEVGTCIEGFVWREARKGDAVCVTPESRSLASQENAQADARRDPNGGFYGPDTCLMGFVWRESYENDHVCVTGERRASVAQENAAAKSRYKACRAVIRLPSKATQVRPKIKLPK